MKLQRHKLFYYFFAVMLYFSLKYFSILKNVNKSFDTILIGELETAEPTLFRSEYLVFYTTNSTLARNISLKLGEYLRYNVISISVFSLDHCDSDYRPDDVTTYHNKDRTNPGGQFKIIVEYEDVKGDFSFNLRVKGGSTLIFTVYQNTVLSEELCERMFALTKKMFLYDGPTKMKQLKPVLDLNFVLMSDKGRVSWNLNEKVLSPYMNYVFSVFSLFYDVYLHSRVVSNVDFLQKFVVEPGKYSSNSSLSDYISPKVANEKNYVLFDLNKQDTNFYNFFEGIANVDVSLKDQHSFRHSLNFFVILPSKPVFLKDPFNGQRRESFEIENLGFFTFLNGRLNDYNRKSKLDKNQNYEKSKKLNYNKNNDTSNFTKDGDNSSNTDNSNSSNTGNTNNSTQSKENDSSSSSSGLGSKDNNKNVNDNGDRDNNNNSNNVKNNNNSNREYKENKDTDLDMYTDTETDSLLEDTYVLNEDDVLELVSTWITYIRHMHHLPASKSEYMVWMSNPDEKIKILGENQFVVSSELLTFQLTFDDPIAVAFYGFEINKLSTMYYNSYIKGALKNLRKVSELKKISFNTQLQESTHEYIMKAFDALELGMGYAPLMGQKAEINGMEVSLQAMDTNHRALALARHAFFMSLEALSDDKMFNKNVLSYEHMLAVFMCDLFPYTFLVLVYYFKFLTQRVQSK